MKRIFWIVLDSAGIGEAPDADKFGDVGSNTWKSCYDSGKLHIPNMEKIGIYQIDGMEYAKSTENPTGSFAKMQELSCGKDTTTGHWEMAGIVTPDPLPKFPDGFPKVFIEEFSKRTGRKILCNLPYSGTQVIYDYGREQEETGALIVYTSADSVLQICGNEETFGLKELYRCCEIAREITMKDEWKVGRVIARPYVGKKKGAFVRTSNRHDYALKPYGRTALNALKDAGYDVISVGKIRDIFDGEGITESNKSKSSVHGMEQTIEIAERDFTGLCFVNLVDFDALWGHRRNVKGYAEELERFDVKLGELLKVLREDDLLIITADHGNDPTYKGTDHTREQVMFVAYSPSMKGSGKLEDQDTFAVIGATIADNFGVQMPENTIGTSVLEELR